MKDFLEIVARDVLNRLGNDLSHTVVIFPNKRANLFFNEWLTPENGTPIWAPRYMSISEFFNSLTHIQIVDPIEAVCRLYRHYCHHLTGPKPSLDFFYGWGERLLADYDDIDKNMVDAKKLFRDIHEYAELEQYDFLDEEQIRQLKRFASDFSREKITGVRENFNRLWEIAYNVYHDFKKGLLSENLSYEGQLFRNVVEQLENGTIEIPKDIEKVIFIGFNVIDGVERHLFDYLKKTGKALFYWDYDTFYAQENSKLNFEAGRFLQENLKDFPNALNENDGYYDNFLHNRDEKVLEFASAPTNIAQAQSITSWLESDSNFNPQKARRTAIVVCDENLLQEVIHSLPSKINEINVTKGFPLGHTPAFSCISEAIKEMEDLQDSSRNILILLRERIKVAAGNIEQLCKGNQWLHELYTEAYFQCYTTLNRFICLIDNGYLEVKSSTLFALVKQVLKNISIPFHGEPAEGLQIMGVLETRCLDFDNIVMLSVNEGVLPHKAGEASFIPFLLRKQYGLTTPDKQNSVFAYYFYRLIQRAKRVRLVYNNSTEGTNKGEMSRFMKSLLVEIGDKIDIRRTSFTSIPKTIPIDNETEKNHINNTELKEDYSISPSALKIYIKCELQYYFKYIKKLRKPQSQDGIINSNDFGSVFHSAAEKLYKNVLGAEKGIITPHTIESFLSDGGIQKLQELTLKAFEENEIAHSEITQSAVVNYLHKLLKYEGGFSKEQPISLLQDIETEEMNDIILPIFVNGKNINVRLYGYIDRKDKAILPDGTECIRIIDYKTGQKRDKDDLKLDNFFFSNKDFPENPLQAFIYSLMWTKKTNLPVIPILYYIPSLTEKSFNPYISINGSQVMDFKEISKDFETRLTEKLAEMLNPNHLFKPTEIKDFCTYCDFKDICNR